MPFRLLTSCLLSEPKIALSPINPRLSHPQLKRRIFAERSKYVSKLLNRTQIVLIIVVFASFKSCPYRCPWRRRRRPITSATSIRPDSFACLHSFFTLTLVIFAPLTLSLIWRSGKIFPHSKGCLLRPVSAPIKPYLCRSSAGGPCCDRELEVFAF